MRLISLQQAIDVLKAMQTYKLFAGDDLILVDKAQVQTELMMLPPAQPEIIRCKDCKHKHLENMVWTCPFGLSGGENFFCGYGAEPYKGEQI